MLRPQFAKDAVEILDIRDINFLLLHLSLRRLQATLAPTKFRL